MGGKSFVDFDLERIALLNEYCVASILQVTKSG